MRASLRIAIRALVAASTLALLILVGAAVLVLAVSRGWQRERIVAELASELGRRVGADVRIASLEGALYDGVVARGVVLTAPDRAPLTIETLSLRFQLGPFLRERRLVLDAVTLEGLDLEIEQKPDAWIVSGVAKPLGGDTEPSETPAPVRSVEIGELTIRAAHVVLTLQEGATRLDATVDGDVRDARWAAGEALALPDRAAATIALAASRVERRAIDRATLDVRFADRALRVERAAAEGAFGAIALTGDASLASELWPPSISEAKADASVAHLDLAPLVEEPRFASQLDGTVQVAFAPDAAAPTGIGLVQANADLHTPKLGDLDVDGVRLRGSFHTDTHAFALDEGFVHGAFGEARANASGIGDHVDAASLRADLRLERLPASWLGGQHLAGRVALVAEGSGSPDDPRGHVELTATELRRGSSRPGRLVVRAVAPGDHALRVDALSFEAGELAVRARAPVLLRIEAGAAPSVVVEKLGISFPGGEAEVRGRVSNTSFAGLRLDLDERDLAATVAAFGIDVPLAGAITGHVTADGAFARPALRGSLTAAPIEFQGRRIERVDIELSPEAQRTLVTLRLQDRGSERMNAAVRVATEALFTDPARLLERGDSEIRLRADALDIAWIGALLGRKPDSLVGRLDVDATVRGTKNAPVLEGTVHLVGGRVAVDGLGEPLGPIEADLQLANDALRITSIRVPGGAGEIRATGQLALRGTAVGASDVEIAVAGFELPKGSVATGRLDGALRLDGTWPAIRLAGRVTIADGHVDLARRRDPVWREIRVHGLPGEESDSGESTPQAEGGFPAALLPATADLELVIPPDMHVQGHGADLRVTGDVRVLKHAGDEPLYMGGIQVVEGRYQFQNRRFEIERGTVTLPGTHEIDPEIDVVAVQKLREVTLRVVVSGRASAPDASLQSDPPLDPSDQLSYLAFGRPASSLGGSEAARLQSAATQVIGQLAFADLAGDLEGVIPLESLRFEGDSEGVGIGGNLAPGIYLRYSRDIATNDDRVGVEWQFRPRWTLRSEVKSNGNAGIDVIWSRDY